MRSPLGSRIPLALLIRTLIVAEYLNFPRAANILGVSQSSVSTRVKLLERILVSCCSNIFRAACG